MEDVLFAAYLLGATGLPGAILGYLVARQWPEAPGRGLPCLGTSFGIGVLCGVVACVVYGAVAAAESPYLFAVMVFAGVTNFLAGTSAAGVVLGRSQE
jgi:hypothetical protein